MNRTMMMTMTTSMSRRGLPAKAPNPVVYRVFRDADLVGETGDRAEAVRIWTNVDHIDGQRVTIYCNDELRPRIERLPNGFVAQRRNL